MATADPGKGRPSVCIPREQLEYFTEMGFTREEIASIFDVSVRTIGSLLNLHSLKRSDRWHELNGKCMFKKNNIFLKRCSVCLKLSFIKKSNMTPQNI